MTMHVASASAPAPPYSSGMCGAWKSLRTSASYDARGNSAFSSASAAFGAILSSASSRTASRSARWSSDSVKCGKSAPVIPRRLLAGSRRGRTPECDVPGPSGERGHDLLGEEADPAVVVGGLVEVRDRVRHPGLLQRLEALDELLGCAHEPGGGVLLHRRREDLSRQVGPQPVLERPQPIGELGLVAPDEHVVVGRPDDLVEVPAHLTAVPLEHLRLVPEALQAAVEIRVARVLRRDPQGLLLAATRDPQWYAAVLQRKGPAESAVHLVVLAGV